MSGSGWETLPEVRKWSGDPLAGPEVVRSPIGGPELVGRLSQRSGTGRETLPEVRKWSGDSAEGLELVERPSQRSVTGR